MTHVTFAGNSVVSAYSGLSGGAVCNYFGSAPTIKNGIFWDNKSKNPFSGIISEDDIFNRDSSILSTTYTLMQLSNTAANYPPASFPAIDSGHNLFAQNPLFVDATSGNLRLQDCSPAINAGDLIGTTSNDLDGRLRPYPYGVAIADMGAYENQSIAGGGPATLNVTEPIINGTVLKVAGEITATNQVAGATALYQATKSVTLLPDFSAIGNGFTAFIGGCETLITSEAPASIKK
ncbi:3-coathanger stack domain-containing protein [Runella rosea]|uniref:3-coathanger stack domain-containing protein n=1 Tax=Runella rosea TaxID=2259595 RepID=UPI0013B3E40E|nr:3-coathanger stack domain-containing protein [Runella rosea]